MDPKENNLKKHSGHFILYLALGGIFASVLYLFRNAFTIPFVLDDFVFVNISRANSIGEFLSFFSPFKDYFYRPLTTELFYFFIGVTGHNTEFGHLVSFLVYFVGLYFLYKTSFILSKRIDFSVLFVFLYAIHFTHVFQLHLLNTFQEVALFTFLTVSFYFFLRKMVVTSLFFFLCALLSKETALMYPLLLVIIVLLQNQKKVFHTWKFLLPYFVLSGVFFTIHRYAVSNVATIDIYQIQFSPQLIINNIEWYLLWGMGVPNFVPNYVVSIFFKFLPDFWNLLTAQDIRWYFILLIVYWIGFLLLSLFVFFKTNKKVQYILFAGVSVFCFFLFLLPVLPIIHRWMVRLTVPMVFLLAAQAFVLYKASRFNSLAKIGAGVLLIIFIAMQYLGIRIHESSGLFLLEAHIVRNTEKVFRENREEILKYDTIYFADTEAPYLGGSKKLKTTFHDQDFLKFYFPEKPIRAVYGFEEANPQKSYIIVSDELIK